MSIKPKVFIEQVCGTPCVKLKIDNQTFTLDISIIEEGTSVENIASVDWFKVQLEKAFDKLEK